MSLATPTHNLDSPSSRRSRKRNLYSERAPPSGLLFELAASSSLKVFDPKPYLLIAGVARQMGEWAIEKIRDLIEFRPSVLKPLASSQMKYLGYDEQASLHPGVDFMVPCLRIAMFGDLFTSSIRNSYDPGTAALRTLIDLAVNSLSILAPRGFFECFDISNAEYLELVEDKSFHDRKCLFVSLLGLQGLKTLEFMYQFAEGEDGSRVGELKAAHNSVMAVRFQNLGMSVDIQHDVEFLYWARAWRHYYTPE
ncbi:hypothetical protein DSL72_005915 [Monilinia vaccinii-corymbosi]|uniref:Uncharacterized protein n=1 Tax=Monilinia vaccinii-corymbosi TaxID=61207 RepID=A0A8A3PH19_9HELO|nr:hypothetical protein DSL72_005915 [Monilinia vaccinii-corymbosi]